MLAACCTFCTSSPASLPPHLELRTSRCQIFCSRASWREVVSSLSPNPHRIILPFDSGSVYSSLNPSTIYLSFHISWQFVVDADLTSRKTWGENLRHGEVKWLARGNNVACRTSNLSLNLQSLSKVFTSLSHAESLQVLVHTSHQPSVHLIPPSCPLLLSVPPTFANGFFTLASCLANILSISYLPYQKLCSLPSRKEWLHAIFPCPSCVVAITQHTQISVWIASCYSASTVNSGCLGQACSQKRSLLSVFLKINNQRKGKVKSSSCPKEMSMAP